jgi:hypothetical protein
MTAGAEKAERSPEPGCPGEPSGQKLFDNYGPVNVREAIGTFFLGILAILLFIALQRSRNHCEALLEEKLRVAAAK